MISKALKELSHTFVNRDNELLIEAEKSGNEELLLLTARTLSIMADHLNNASKDAVRLEALNVDGLKQVASFAAEIENDSKLNSYADTITDLLTVLGEKNNNEVVDFDKHIKKLALNELYDLKKNLEREYRSTYAKVERVLKNSELPIESKKRRIEKMEDKLADIEERLDLVVESIRNYETETIGKAAKLASALDSVDDEELTKLASVLDEILLTIGADKGFSHRFKLAEDKEVERLREKFREESLKDCYSVAKIEENKQNNKDEANKIIDEKIKNYKPMEHALSTRYSPDMPGVSLMRIGDNVYQCPITKKIFNYDSGYTTSSGDNVPGTSVAEQTQSIRNTPEQHVNFSTREEILNSI